MTARSVPAAWACEWPRGHVSESPSVGPQTFPQSSPHARASPQCAPPQRAHASRRFSPPPSPRDMERDVRQWSPLGTDDPRSAPRGQARAQVVERHMVWVCASPPPV